MGPNSLGIHCGPRWNMKRRDMHDAQTRSRIMSSIRTKATGPELHLLALLSAHGIRASAQAKHLPGTPDIIIRGVKLAIFVDGDFWHGRPWFERGEAPYQNKEFWINKFVVNQARDRRVDIQLRSMGWSVLRIWASDLKKTPLDIVRLIHKRIRARRNRLNKPDRS
jgi:DNA mismatch endonuclease Vsr